MAFDRIKAEATPIPDFNGAEDKTISYIISKPLAEAANIAIYLERPLIITGEAGTGKTALAFAVAAQLNMGPPLEFHCKSNSVGKDLLYQVDNMRRLYDAHAATKQIGDMAQYIGYAALGEAFLSELRRVVLIDEIDKTPRDFPNDLLNELSRGQFMVPEIAPNYCCVAKHRPVVIITSNSERRLPTPFLRRCIYHHIAFPGASELHDIVAAHTQSMNLSSGFIQLAINRFLEIREIRQLSKQPSTDELIVWTQILRTLDVDNAALENTALSKLPGLQVLIKNHEDLLLLENKR